MQGDRLMQADDPENDEEIAKVQAEPYETASQETSEESDEELSGLAFKEEVKLGEEIQKELNSKFETETNEPEKKERFSEEASEEPIADVIKQYASKLPPSQRARFAELYLEKVKGNTESRTAAEPDADSKAKFLLNRVDADKNITEEVLKQKVRITPR